MAKNQTPRGSIGSILGLAAGWEYLLSLPERTVRSLTALLAGTSYLLTQTLLPEGLKRTTTYKVFFGNLQTFLITRVAQVDYQGSQETSDVGADFARQKLAGNLLEAAGLLTVQFSPLWIFAIAGDAAAGSNHFLYRLTEHLKANQLIEPESRPSNLTELLESIQVAATKSATAIDTPPLSRSELSALAKELVTSYKDMFARGRTLAPRFQALLDRMERLAKQENVSLERLSGLMAVDVASMSKKGVGATRAFGKAGSELVGEQILDSYTRTLDDISQIGVRNYTGRTLRPFLEAAAEHFNPEKITWTEEKLNRRDRAAGATGSQAAEG